MRVLIPGGAGFIAAHTAELLPETGYQVHIIGRAGGCCYE